MEWIFCVLLYFVFVNLFIGFEFGLLICNSVKTKTVSKQEQDNVCRWLIAFAACWYIYWQPGGVASWLIVVPLICPSCPLHSLVLQMTPLSPVLELNTGPVSSLGVERDFMFLRSHDRQPEGRRLDSFCTSWLDRAFLPDFFPFS